MTTSISLVNGQPTLATDVRLQQLWIAAQQRTWRSIAVVSSGPNVPTLEAAHMLARIAWWYAGEPTAVIDLRFLSLRLLNHQIADIRQQVALGDRVFVALMSQAENPTAVPIAQAVDAVVLGVVLGTTTVRAAQATIDAVGRERFLGSILVHPEPAPNGRAGSGR
ncbi:MAG: hypothetical protein ABTD50_13105 [Polyangiaceae bacterium]|jgi:hypothetical protein